MAQVIKIKRGGLASLVASTPTLQQGELLLATGSLNGLGATFFVADDANTPELPYAKIESISDGPTLAASLDSNFTGLLIHSASDNKLYRYNGSAFVELPIAAGSFVGTLPVSNGGTNATSFADKAVIISQDSGTDTLSALTLTTSGQLVIGGASGPAAATLTEGTGLTITNGDGSISIATNDGEIVHDNLSGFVANEHINHSSVTLTAGNGLTGGGDITTNRTFNVGAGDGISVAADSVAVDATVLRTTGDGVISSSAQIDHDATTNFVSNEHIDHTSVSITAGNGLSGGGTIAATRTLSINTGSQHFTEAVADIVGGMTTGNTETLISVQYQDADNTLDFVVDDDLSQYDNTTSNFSTVTQLNASSSALQSNIDGKQDTLTFGIANTNAVKIDHASVADNDYAKFTANGLEGRSYQEVRTDLQLGTSDSPTFAGLTVTGDVSVQGSLTTVNSNEVNLGDRIITLNTADGAGDAGIQVHDTSTNQTGSLLWDTDGDYWKVGISGSTDYRLVEWDGETAGAGDFIHTDSNGRINAINTSTAGDLLVSDGDGTFTVTNVIDGGTY